MNLIILNLALLVALNLHTTQMTPVVSSQVKEHLNRVAEGLRSDSLLHKKLSEGVHGDGVHYPWMDEMRRDGVKRVEVEIGLEWFFGPRREEVKRVMYFTDYEGPESQITDPVRIKYYQTSGLEEELKRIALERGRHGAWFEDPPHQHPPHWWFFPSATEIELMDDEWLPVPPPFYWDYDTSWTPLVDAVVMGDRYAIQGLLSQGKLKANDLDEALNWAAAGDDPRTVQDLLKAGAAVNLKDKNGRTALFAAVNNKKLANVKIILDAGANPNIRAIDTGDTPLTSQLYFREDASELVRLLLSKGADPNIGNKFGRTPLILASFGQPASVIQELIRAGANISAQAENGDTALIVADENNNTEAAKVLLAHGAHRRIKAN